MNHAPPQEPADAFVPLPGGRRLAYRVYGDARGQPLYFFHGFPGSRLQAALVHEQARACGFALVAFDRPGFGLSDPGPANRVDDVAVDVQHLSQALGHRRFGLIGVSCGGPHALATAARLPDQVVGVGLLAGIGPMDRPELRVGQHPLLRLMFLLARWHPALIGPLPALDRFLFRRHPERAVMALASMLTAPDRALIERSAAVRAAFGASLAEAYRQGIGGALQEARRIAHFQAAQLDAVKVPVCIYQSGQDHNVPPAMGRFMAARLPRASYHDCPQDGHLSIVIDRFAACARRVMQDA